MSITKLSDNMYISDKGLQGQVDAEDTIYLERNGVEGLQERDEIIWDNSKLNPESGKALTNRDHFGLFEIAGLPIDTLSQYVSKYSEIKKEAAVQDKDRETFESHLKKFMEEGRALLKKTPNMYIEEVLAIAVGHIRRIDFDHSPVLRFRAQAEILREMRKLRAEVTLDPEMLQASSVTISDLLASLAALAKDNPLELQLQKEMETLYQEEVAYLESLKTGPEKPAPEPVADELLNRQEEQVNKLNASLMKILREAPFHPKRGEILYRLAALEIERADMAVKRQTKSQPDYSKAIKFCKQVLQEFPDYDRLDEVMYQLAAILTRSGEAKQGASYLSRLIKQFPGSPYLVLAYKEVGDYYYDNDLLFAARTNYAIVFHQYGRSASKGALREIIRDARFRLASTYARMGEPFLAIEIFKEALTLQLH